MISLDISLSFTSEKNYCHPQSSPLFLSQISAQKLASKIIKERHL